MHRPLNLDHEWNRFASDLAPCIAALEDDDVLILEYKRANYFVQFWRHGRYGMRAEAASNAYVEPPIAKLTVEQYQQLDALGWQRATYAIVACGVDDDAEGTPRIGSPNFQMDICAPFDENVVAQITARTFREVYRVGHPTWLQYHAFAFRGGMIRFPTLRISRRRRK